MLVIDQIVKDRMIEDAIGAFPDECCGFFFGRETLENDRQITDMLVVVNSKPGDKTRRFEISPLDYLKAEQYAIDKNLLLLGVYHSHPNHPAIPSEHDRKSAQPWFSYVIISIMNGEFANLRSWVINNESIFEEEKITDYQITQIN
ncbi:MAG: Mov34/MPN/PAD-1 family protein [Chitinophagales bacterium]